MKKTAIYALLLANFLFILFFWWKSSGTYFSIGLGNILLALGRLSGLLAVYSVLIQFILMGRVRWIEKIFGLDRLAVLHHWNGYVALSFIVVHPIFITTSYALDDKVNLLSQFLDFLLHYDDVLKAFLSVLIFITVVIVSIYIVRKKMKYEYWYFIHLSTYIAIILAWGHQLTLGGDFGNSKIFTYYWYLLYIFVFGNVLIYRFLRQTYLFARHQFSIEKIVPETENTTSIYITGKKLHTFKSKPGQFLSLRFLNKFWWQQHPFSLSLLPNEKHLRVTVKNSGDFTAHIHSFKTGTPILLDGPFGSFTKSKNHHHKMLFVAGGIGITPIRVLIEQSAAEGKDLSVIYANRTTREITFKTELDSLAKKYKFPIHYIVSQDPKHKGETGRVDREKLQRLVKDIQQRDIFICGPTRMIDFVEKELKALKVPSSQIHYEKFTL